MQRPWHITTIFRRLHPITPMPPRLCVSTPWPLLAMFICRLALELRGAVIRLPGESYRLRVRNQTKEPQPRRPASKLLGLMLLVPLCSSVRHSCADRTYAR